MSTKPVAAETKADVAALSSRFGVSQTTEFRGETTVHVPSSVLLELLKFCKESLGYTFLVDITSIDHMGQEPRFEVVYELLHFATCRHLRVKTTVSEDDLALPSVVSVWSTADWHEREIFDMMGIRFSGHPDLRRILMWEGYPHFPLRKDFPLQGRSTDVPEVAFTEPAPLAGGPFVTSPSTETTQEREPRSRERF
jgi:NADH-quinone oxidoreductase subunit C